jgi:hypothetical protein
MRFLETSYSWNFFESQFLIKQSWLFDFGQKVAIVELKLSQPFVVWPWRRKLLFSFICFPQNLFSSSTPLSVSFSGSLESSLCLQFVWIPRQCWIELFQCCCSSFTFFEFFNPYNTAFLTFQDLPFKSGKVFSCFSTFFCEKENKFFIPKKNLWKNSGITQGTLQTIQGSYWKKKRRIS